MSEALASATQELKEPEFTTAHENGVLRRQRQMLSLQVNGNRARKQLEELISTIDKETEKAAQELGNYLNEVAKELKIDVGDYTFDLDSLKLVRKPKVAEGPGV